MSELFEFSLADLISCAMREVKMRRRVYANRVASGTMLQEKADQETDMMLRIEATLRALSDGQYEELFK